MKSSRSRRGRGRPLGWAVPRRRGRGKPRATRRAPIVEAAVEPPAAEPTGLVAVAEQRIVADQDAPQPAPPPARRRLWPLALPLLLLVIAGGVAWFLFWHEQRMPPGEGMVGTATAVDVVAIKQLLRQLDFIPGPDDVGLDPATREAIRQFQAAAGQPATGEPSAELLDELRQVAAPLGTK